MSVFLKLLYNLTKSALVEACQRFKDSEKKLGQNTFIKYQVFIYKHVLRPLHINQESFHNLV